MHIRRGEVTRGEGTDARALADATCPPVPGGGLRPPRGMLACVPLRAETKISRDLRVMRVRESSVHYENVFTRSRPKNVHQPWPLALK